MRAVLTLYFVYCVSWHCTVSIDDCLFGGSILSEVGTANEILPLQIKIAPLCEGFKLFFSDPCVWERALSSRFIAKLLWFIKGPAVFHLFRDQNHHIKLKSRQKKESSSAQNNNQNRESRI